MTLDQYIESVNAKYKLGNATEHTFRGLLEQLLESIVPEIRVTNEPKRQQCGAPDYILTKKEIPVGFIEAKDVDGNFSNLRCCKNKKVLSTITSARMKNKSFLKILEKKYYVYYSKYFFNQNF